MTEIKRKAHRCITLKMATYSCMMLIPSKRGNRWFWSLNDRDKSYNYNGFSIWIWFCPFCGEQLEKKKRNWPRIKAFSSIIISGIFSLGLIAFVIWREVK